jgi:hypothetical protein
VKEIFDPRALGAESKIDIGIFFAAAGAGGILDAIWNVAAFAEPFTFAAICGPAAFGAKKLVEGLFDRSPPGPPRAD